MSAVPVYPVRVEGRLDPHLSRWLWLVKWLLVIPHLIVLAFLWIAFAVLTFIAFFAIVFTGSYPRSIFDFNVGVLRWSWRVGFYSCSALGTDRYPPFSLAEEPDYPATLEIAYPQHLSRGLVFVKSWLLAIPHYLIVGFFTGAGWFATQHGGGGGLIFAIVLIAGFALLFTQNYPRGLFDFALGLNRWGLRVAAYSALMTDAYPPFRLDLGGSEPATLPVTPERETPSAPGSPHVVIGVLASIALLFGVIVAIAGSGAIVVDLTQRDAAGYVMTPREHYGTTGYALTTSAIDVPVTGPDRLARDLIGNVRIKSESSSTVFIGIARRADADRYLASVRRSVIRNIGEPSSAVERGLGPPAAPPTVHKFWAAETAGSGSQTLNWKVRNGKWVAVVMNVDAKPGVYADLRMGAELDNLGWIGAGVLGGGILLIAVGGTGLWFAFRRS